MFNDYDILFLEGVGKTTRIREKTKLKTIAITKDNIAKILYQIQVGEFNYEFIIIDDMEIIGQKMNLLLLAIKYLFPTIKIVAVCEPELRDELIKYFSEKKYKIKNLGKGNAPAIEFIDEDDIETIINKSTGRVIIYSEEARLIPEYQKKYGGELFSETSDSKVILTCHNLRKYFIPNVSAVIDTIKITNTINNPFKVEPSWARDQKGVERQFYISKTKSKSRMSNLRGQGTYYVVGTKGEYDNLPNVYQSSLIKNLGSWAHALLYILGLSPVLFQAQLDNGELDLIIPIPEEYIIQAKGELISEQLIDETMRITSFGKKMTPLTIWCPCVSRYKKLISDSNSGYGYISACEILIKQTKYLASVGEYGAENFDFTKYVRLFRGGDIKRVAEIFVGIIKAIRSCEIALTDQYVELPSKN